MSVEDLKQQWADIPEWQKLVLIIAAGFFVLYGIYFMFVQPKQETITKIQKEVNILESEVNRLKKFATPENLRKLDNDIVNIQNEVAKLKEELKEIEKIIPSGTNINEVLAYVSMSAMNSKMILDSFKVYKEKHVVVSYDEKNDILKIQEPQKVKTAKKGKKKKKKKKKKHEQKLHMKQIQIEISLKGNVKNLKAFLTNLSKSKRYIAVDKLHLVKGKDNLSSKIKLNTLYLPEE